MTLDRILSSQNTIKGHRWFLISNILLAASLSIVYPLVQTKSRALPMLWLFTSRRRTLFFLRCLNQKTKCFVTGLFWISCFVLNSCGTLWYFILSPVLLLVHWSFLLCVYIIAQKTEEINWQFSKRLQWFFVQWGEVKMKFINTLYKGLGMWYNNNVAGFIREGRWRSAAKFDQIENPLSKRERGSFLY